MVDVCGIICDPETTRELDISEKYSYKNTILNILKLTKLEKLKIKYLGIENIDFLEQLTSLKYLDCSHNLIQSLNHLPPNLITLICDSNQISDFSNLPLSLKHLECSGTGVTKLDNLPLGLKYLDCSFCKRITNLDFLPPGLDELHCSFTGVGDLDYLPANLRILKAYNCQELENLDNLPPSLKILECGGVSLIKTLNNLPNSLKLINYKGSVLPRFEIIPEGLEELNIDNITKIYKNKLLFKVFNHFTYSKKERKRYNKRYNFYKFENI